MRAEKEIKYIPINLIKQNTYQPRKHFNQEALLELSESIREFGVLQPISIRRYDDTFYELVAGERRLRASQLAGLTEIPAIIVDISDVESAVLALIENLQREDLNYIEEAEGYLNLMKDHGITQEELARRIGKKQSTIANKLRILKLPESIKERLIKENLTERHARALLKLSDEDIQHKIIDEIVKRGLNVKKTEELVERELENLKENINKKNEESTRHRWAINPRIITNTLRQIMEKNGIEAEYSHREKEEYMEIIVRIPKGNKEAAV
ncbi:ParB/RepB/Spo0J family partition protein [Fonticella tunisiensis]|uniref:ParB family protein n=1 Tax=Fonticella tunisiensis TaxID=1096341 RepID=A0A4R7KBM4_9CLOT|nr:ParB/RepB/Spo0J family partition protein [Fonticella tunisiensis]TDT50490.1 ParB family protein [Fonticella tunisiensis]